jgi:hypothetical protein
MADPKQDAVPLPNAEVFVQYGSGHYYSAAQMRAYGQACALAASMRAAQVCREDGFRGLTDFADAGQKAAYRWGYWHGKEACAEFIEADAGIKGPKG